MNVLKASLSSRKSSYKSWPIIFFDNPDRPYQSWLKPRTTEHSGDLVFYSKRRGFGGEIFADSGDLEEIVGQILPVFCAIADRGKPYRLRATDGVACIEKIVTNLLFGNHGVFGIWDRHPTMI